MIALGTDLAPCIEQIAEPTRREAFLAQAAVGAFYVCVFDRLAGPDMYPFDALLQTGNVVPKDENSVQQFECHCRHRAEIEYRATVHALTKRPTCRSSPWTL